MEFITTDLEPAEFVSQFIGKTNKNIFLTGKAGTGKTTLLHYLVNHTFKKCIVAAPTGIAAINAKGITLHSLFQLPFGAYIPVMKPSSSFNENSKFTDSNSLIKGLQMFDKKRALLREMELLIIDEVSMLRADMLDAIDVILRHVRRKHNLPFGGVQVLFIGDLLQLPPVVKDFEWNELKQYYTSIYFFDSKVLTDFKPVYIELDKIYRQVDNTFVNLLNHLRNNEMTSADYELLNNYYKPNFKATDADPYIYLTTHNNKANELNRDYLNRLTTKSFYFEAKVDGDFNENAYPIEKTMELKKGAQIMFVKNDPTGQQRFFNGKLGIITALSDEKIEVEFADTKEKIIVAPYEWENVKYKLSATSNDIEENIAGTFTQYPIKLAWAITVHKSQGLTFDKAIIDIGDAFAPGQVYVALSRLRSLAGLVLTSKINTNSISKDEKIGIYSKSLTEQQNLKQILIDETYVYIKTFVLKAFEFDALIRQFQEHTDSYVKKDEARSVKQRHHNWAKELEKQIVEIKPVADKFRNQVLSITSNLEGNYLEHLYARVVAAAAYFTPVLKSVSSKILKHAESIKAEKKIKVYMQELLDLELMIFEQVKLISKSAPLIQSTFTKIELTGVEVKKLYTDTHRSELMRQLFSSPAKGVNEDGTETIAKEPKPRIRKPKGEKKPKVDTKLETLKLYQAGKSVDSIAGIRQMTVGTIEGHLAHYVTKGELKASDFISQEKADDIIATSKKLNTLFFGQIKQALGDKYTYAEIKFAVAGFLSEKE